MCQKVIYIHQTWLKNSKKISQLISNAMKGQYNRAGVIQYLREQNFDHLPTPSKKMQ